MFRVLPCAPCVLLLTLVVAADAFAQYETGRYGAPAHRPGFREVEPRYRTPPNWPSRYAELDHAPAPHEGFDHNPVEHASWPTHDMRGQAGALEQVGYDPYHEGAVAPVDGLSRGNPRFDPTVDGPFPEKYDGAPHDGIQPAGYPQSPNEFDLPRRPGRVRQRVWQPPMEDDLHCDSELPWIAPYQTKVRTTVLFGNGDELGMTDVDVRHTLAFPHVPGLTLTPGGIVSFIDGPVRTDLPGRLYSTWIELQYQKQLTPRWAMQLAVAPGLYTDFEDVDSDALRITGRALAFWGLSQQTQIVFGVVYLDREDVSILPAAGIIHQPNENVRWEILFPRPRVLYNVRRWDNGCEGWVYLAGEFGGGSWSIQRAGGASDVATYGDLRLIGGWETRWKSGRAAFVEGGWVFSRSLEYTSGLGDYDPDGVGMVRAGVTF